MNNKYLLFLAFVIIVSAIVACSASSFNVTSDYDRDNDFTKYRTYKYIPQPFDSVTLEPLVPLFRQRRIEAGIDLELEKRGYRYAEENPDFLVSYFVKVGQGTRQGGGGVGIGVAVPGMYTNPAYNMNYGNRYYSGNPYTYSGGSYAWTSTGGNTTTTYTTGSLMVDIVDAKTVQLVWYGRANGEISSDPKKTQYTIDKACSDVFSGFLWKVE